MIESFSPWVFNNTRILILGSMPSVVSLSKRMYYGNSKNLFWKMMSDIFNKGVPLEEDEIIRKEFLKNNDLGLWDVLKFCNRKGSLDAKIKNEIPNDLTAIVNKLPSLRRIVINGKSKNNSASYYFYKYFEKEKWISSFEIKSVVSSSSAYPIKYNSRLEYWKEALLK